jgi:hypothetical protein
MGGQKERAMREVFDAALESLGVGGWSRNLSGQKLRQAYRRARQAQCEADRRYTPVLPVMPMDQRPTPPSVAKHRRNIDGSRRKTGPFYTPKTQ